MMSTRKVPLLDLKAQYETVRAEVEGAVRRVLESGHYILGPEVEALETELAAVVTSAGSAFTHVRAAGVSSGTDALLVALMALGIQPGDEVIIPAFSFFATAGCVARLGARPVFADIDPETFNLDPASALARVNSRTRAVMPVHLFGRCAELAPYREQHLPIIEDAAQAFGAHGADGPACGIGTVACISFFPSKNLGTAGDAGAVFSADPKLLDRVRLLRAHGARPKYNNIEVGGNFRIDALHAAILRAKLPRLSLWTEARRKNAQRYRRLLEGTPLGLPRDVPGHAYNQFTVRVPSGRRDALRTHLIGQGVGSEIYYPSPLHLQPCFAALGHRPGDFPESERACGEALSLPIYPELSDDDAGYVADAIRAFYKTA
jgi:dTDP-4-amino-4,6-dideoxygalactose transaminase